MLIETLFSLVYPEVKRGTQLSHLGWANKWLAGDILSSSAYISNDWKFLTAVPPPKRDVNPTEKRIRSALYSVNGAGLTEPPTDRIDSNFLSRRTDTLFQIAQGHRLAPAVLGDIARISSNYNTKSESGSSVNFVPIVGTALLSNYRFALPKLINLETDTGFGSIGKSEGTIEFSDDVCVITNGTLNTQQTYDVGPEFRDSQDYIRSGYLVIPGTPDLAVSIAYEENSMWSYEIEYRPRVDINQLSSRISTSDIKQLVAELELEKLPESVSKILTLLKELLTPYANTWLMAELNSIFTAIVAVLISSALRFR